MKSVLLASTAALALCAGTASGAPTLQAKAPVHRVISAVPGSVTLYDQTSGESSSAISSQNFTSGAFADYDDQAADDFTVPTGHKWKVTEVDVPGVNTGPNPATSLNVIFYKNSHGLPGSVVRECDNQSSAGYDGFGGYAIKLDQTCTGKGSLKSGTYWVSVIANQDLTQDAQWYWDSNLSKHGGAAQWQNPNNGFGECPSWCKATNIVPSATDLAFTLKGKDRIL